MSNPEQIAGYDVKAVLGYGAHSTIYVVQDPKDEQLYALKRVVRQDAAEQRFIDQAINEYEIGSRVQHPNIRRCFDIQKHKQMFKVNEVTVLMELVTGQTLVQQQPETMSGLIRLFVVVAEALHGMHAQGYVHADLKPNNIIVAENGDVKIIDLGQSCPVGTVKERIQGTPDYIAPEQVNREPLTPVTDVFNLGATMYWCVTGQHVPTLIPKDAGGNGGAPADNELNSKDLNAQGQIEVRPPIDFNPEMPVALNTLLVHCLKFQAYERPQSMTEVAARLRVALKQIGNKWDKNELVQAFQLAFENKDMEKAVVLLQEMDGYLSPEEAKPYMDPAREVLAWAKNTFGERFKIALKEKRWADALREGKKIVKAFPNTAFADEVREVVKKLKREAERQRQVQESKHRPPDGAQAAAASGGMPAS